MIDGSPKEEFLYKNGMQIGEDTMKDYVFNSKDPRIPVVLVDNGLFTAAAVIYSPSEMKAFLDNPKDKRIRICFFVNREDVLTRSLNDQTEKEIIKDI